MLDTPMTPEDFLKFCDELAKRGPIVSISALGYHVDFQRPHNDQMAEVAKEFLPLFKQLIANQGNHLRPVPK